MTELDPIADLAIPTIVWLLMLMVGLELTAGDFRRVLRYPRAVTVATLGQLLLLPACSALLIWLQRPEPWVVAGMVLLAASPGGAISNLYSYLGLAPSLPHPFSHPILQRRRRMRNLDSTPLKSRLHH